MMNSLNETMEPKVPTESDVIDQLHALGLPEMIEEVKTSDPTAIEIIEAIKRYVESPNVSPEQKERLVTFAKDLAGQTADQALQGFKTALTDDVLDTIKEAGEQALGITFVKNALTAAGFAFENWDTIVSVIKASPAAARAIAAAGSAGYNQLQAGIRDDGELDSGEVATAMTQTVATLAQEAGNDDQLRALLVQAAGQALGYALADTDDIKDLIVTILIDMTMNYLGLSSELRISTSPLAESAISLVAMLAGDAWNDVAGTLMLLAPIYDSYYKSGASVVTGVAGLLDYLGFATSKGAAFSQHTFSIEAGDYTTSWVVISMGGLQVALATDPFSAVLQKGTAIRIASSKPYGRVIGKAINKANEFGNLVNQAAYSITSRLGARRIEDTLLSQENQLVDAIMRWADSSGRAIAKQVAASLARSLMNWFRTALAGQTTELSEDQDHPVESGDQDVGASSGPGVGNALSGEATQYLARKINSLSPPVAGWSPGNRYSLVRMHTTKSNLK